MAIHVACGSWADAEYVGVLYPKELSAKQRLSGYARWFDHVEVNSSYYATPRANIVEGWIEQTPPEFTFNVKLHRAFSQSPDKTARESPLLGNLLEVVQPLIKKKKLAAFLLVLPPSFGPDRHHLTELDVLAEKLHPHPLAVELRHSGWVKGAQRELTLDYFRDKKLGWVAVDMPTIKGSTIMPAVDVVTNPHCAYLRLHGRNKNYLNATTAEEGHTYAYSPAELKEIAARVRVLADHADFVHVVANNHAEDFAPKTALALQESLGVRLNKPSDELF